MANTKYKTQSCIKMPEKLTELAEIFEQNGHQLFAVGGFVRNSLLNISGGDIDICSDLDAKTVFEMLKDDESFFTVQRDSDLGTIAVHDKKSKQYFEYTAFRQDNYSEGGKHRPEYVTLTNDMLLDAKRRDFTIGALYADANDGFVYDPLNALYDLDKGLIKTTSDDPFEIIKDDGLRILRMVRFACELGFYIDPLLYKQAKKHIGYLKDIAVERITEEFNKIILSDKKYLTIDKRISMPEHLRGMLILFDLGALEYIMPELLEAKGTKQNKKFHAFDVLTHLFFVYKLVPPELELRLAGLLHDIGKPEAKKDHGDMKGHAKIGTEIAYIALKRLKYKNSIIDRVCLLISEHMYDLRGNIAYEDLLEHLARLGLNESEQLLVLKKADASGKGKEEIDQDIIEKWERALNELKKGCIPLSVNELLISGEDIKQLGIYGKDIGFIKEKLFSYVIRHPKENKKDRLIELSKEFYYNKK